MNISKKILVNVNLLMEDNNISLFRLALEEYEKENELKNESVNGMSVSNTCSHTNIINEKDVFLCIDCGEEFQIAPTYDKEWRYYGKNDSKHSSDPNRVQLRKIDERSIYKDVETLGFSESVVSLANKYYNQITNGKIFRGNSRKALIFSCIYHAFKLSNMCQPHEKLIKIFNLDRKTALKGLKYVNLYALKDSKIRTSYTTPVDLVGDLMELFSATKEQKKEVLMLYDEIKNKSSKLNRSRPQSISSGLVFYWICLKGKNISLKEFAKKSGLSELTISKISKEISRVLNDN